MTIRVNISFRSLSAGAASLVASPHIVVVYDRFEQAGQGFIVMEYVEGSSFDRLLKQRAYSTGDVAEWFSQIFDAVSAAHAQHITHRDLKPGNILVTRDEQGRALLKLVDFGLAKQKPPLSSCQTLTRSLGTLPYASPEQRVRLGRVDERSDIYSLGVMLFEVLAGALPYSVESDDDLLLAIVNHHMCFERGSHLDPPLLSAIQKCLERDPSDRFQTVHDLKKEVLPRLTELHHLHLPGT